ncbi:MAG TPA: xanthine dehydrogenase family protein molybdopterin-binding subunit [Thermoanaerobaculia bacterium]|nr:xanthine dehydrogenase family protein molybdopterin-binding subunit [Thermoanaerobaculia bacterium]
MTASPTSYVGKSRPLLEGREKVVGATRFGTDQWVPRTLHARLVSSPYPHARITRLDTVAAAAVPGVVRVFTAKDLPDLVPAARHRMLLARDRVLFAGQPVALVVAETEAAAEDGAEATVVDYEPLAAATTIDEAMAPGAPLVWPEGVPGSSGEAAAHGATVGADDKPRKAPSNVTGEVTFAQGDVEAELAASAAVLEATYETAGVHQSYLEPHAVLVAPNPATGGATVYTSTQASFYVREEIASVLGIPESDVNVVPTAVGGGFGGKFVLHDPLVALAARAVGHPVKLVLSRGEELAAGTPAPASRIRMRVGAKQDGTLTALDAEFLMDDGCYPAGMAGLAGILLGSPYRIASFRIKASEVLTFKASVGAYRAPCAPQAAFALEQALDELARRLEMDPLELRLRNAARPGDPMAHRAPWPSMGLSEVLRALADHPAWKNRDAARKAGRGVGVAVGGWPGGTEPAAASCSIERDGTLHVHVGSVDITGSNTSIAILAAEAFGIDPAKVRVVSGDTDNVPYAGASGGSKTIYTVGPAAIAAAKEARQQTLELAGQMLEAAVADLEITDGKVQVRGAPDQAIPIAKIAARTMRFGGRHAPVFGHGRHQNAVQSPAFCAQLAEVEVDRETGHVTLHKLVIVQDAGRAINPAAVEGQMMGGALQGVGWALFEGLEHGDGGQLLTGSLMDYAVPGVDQSPHALETEIVEVPAELGPMGARGVGEPPVIATAAAIANAITDATSARLTRLPMTPPRVLEAIAASAGRSDR